ncbi:MAG: RNase adapter RapZ [Alphaproteobacteria bacterium]
MVSSSAREAFEARVLLVTGISGAGKTSVLKALEDMGYEAVDNIPLSLMSSLVRPSSSLGSPLAIGVDIRTRDFGAESFMRELDELIRGSGNDVQLVFIDCDDEILRRRYSETRRRHPLAADRPVLDGIAHERGLIAPLRDRADVVIDTSNLSLGELRQRLEGHFALHVTPGLAISVVSFSYRQGLPREADLVFDVRFLANPHYQDALRPMTGRDEAVAEFIAADPDFTGFFETVVALLARLIPRYHLEGKSYLTVAVGCTGGRHRSVYVAERLNEWLCAEGHRVSLAHRDLRTASATS